MKRVVAGLIVALWTSVTAADTLKDGYFACGDKSLYDDLMEYIAKGDEPGIRHSLWDGCMIVMERPTIKVISISETGAAKVLFFHTKIKNPIPIWVHKDAIERTANPRP